MGTQKIVVYRQMEKVVRKEEGNELLRYGVDMAIGYEGHERGGSLCRQEVSYLSHDESDQ